MHKYLLVLKHGLACLLIISLPVQATNLPEQLLHTPIPLITGQNTSLADYIGIKPVYLKFWATWCQPCRKQMPHFEQVQQQYGERIEVISINLGLNDDLQSVQETIAEFGLTMPTAIDENGDLAHNFRLIGTPYHLLFDSNMNLVHQGHDADESLDNKLALLAESHASDIINAGVLVQNEADIQFDANDGKTHALFFTATWCDWYLQDSRPQVSQACVAGQHTINTLYKRYPQLSWLGVASRLWTGDKDILEYKKKHAVEHPLLVDRSNRLFHRYHVKDLPTLVLIRNNEIISRSSDFSDANELQSLFNKLPK